MNLRDRILKSFDNAFAQDNVNDSVGASEKGNIKSAIKSEIKPLPEEETIEATAF